MAKLKLRLDNLYANGVINEYKDGTSSLDREPINYTPTERDDYHTLVQGDTLSDLANKKYKNSKLWHIIAEVNNIEFPFELEPGLTIVLPDYEKIKSTNKL